MADVQAQKCDEHRKVILNQSTPSIPAEGDVCFINEIPPEILSRIFELGRVGPRSSAIYRVRGCNEMLKDPEDAAIKVHATEAHHAHEPEWPPPVFQISVSHVCHHWRNVAVSTPSLWTVIQVGPRAHTPYEFTATVLERSKSVPIDVIIESRRSTTSTTDFTFLRSLLLPHIHRWRSLRLSLPNDLLRTFLSKVPGSFISAAPTLEVLALQYRDSVEDDGGNVSKRINLFAGSAPSLSRLYLVGVHVDWSQSWISASNLRVLQLAFQAETARPSWAQFSTILRNAHSLERLDINHSGPSGEPAEWFTEECSVDLNAPIHLPRLTELILRHLSAARATGLLCKLYLPSLKYLSLSLWDGEYTAFVRELARPAVFPSGPRSLLSGLDTLQIKALPCRIDDVRTLYSELQNVRTLILLMRGLPEMFFDVLGTPREQGAVYLPGLQKLFIYFPSGEVVQALVEKRMGLGAPLESLYLSHTDADMSSQDMDWLQENVKTFQFFSGIID